MSWELTSDDEADAVSSFAKAASAILTDVDQTIGFERVAYFEQSSQPTRLRFLDQKMLGATTST